MKIELDFDQRIITVVSEVNMQELYDKMKELKLDPKEWKLQHNLFSWTTPQIYPIVPIGTITTPNIPYPQYGPPYEVTCSSDVVGCHTAKLN